MKKNRTEGGGTVEKEPGENEKASLCFSGEKETGLEGASTNNNYKKKRRSTASMKEGGKC